MRPGGTFDETYQQDMAIVRTRLQWGVFIAFLLLLVCLPLFVTEFLVSFITVIGIICITVLGLNIVTGYCGQISLGQAAFMAVGAYTTGILAKHGLPLWITLPASGLVAALSGLVVGIPSLRVKGFYLVLTTLAAQFIIVWLIFHLPTITGGAMGLPVARPTLGNIAFDSERSMYYLVLAISVLMTILAKNIIRTRSGRAFVAIRDNDLAAAVMGINVFGYKLLAFAISAFYAGIAGCLFAYYIRYLSVDSFTLVDSVWYLGMIIVGGMGSITGTILGVIFLRGTREFIDRLVHPLKTWLPGMGAGAEAAFLLIPFALIVILFLIFEPRGLAHRWEVLKASYRLWPYRAR